MCHLAKLHKVAWTNRQQTEFEDRIGMTIRVDEHDCCVTIPKNSIAFQQQAWTEVNRITLVKQLLGHVKAHLCRKGTVLGMILQLNRGDETLVLTDSELGFLKQDKSLIWATPGQLRQAILEKAYQNFQDGVYDLGETQLNPARETDGEWLDKSLLTPALRFLVMAGFLEASSPNRWSLTAKAIDRIEQAMRPSARFGFGVLAFRQETDKLWSGAMSPALIDLGLTPIRIDAVALTNPIIDGIHAMIEQSHLVVVDLTFSRPNCYYELGFAHALRKPVILSVKDDRRDQDIHFDVEAFRVLRWSDSALDEHRRQLIEEGQQLLP